MTTNAPPSGRRRFQTKKHDAIANPVAGKNGHEPSRTTLACALLAIVSCVVAANPEGVTVVGLNEQVAFAGNPEQTKLTAELKPFCGVTVRVTLPCPPDAKVKEEGDVLSVKLGDKRLIVYVPEATALLE
jgi:hypothetical protein